MSGTFQHRRKLTKVEEIMYKEQLIQAVNKTLMTMNQETLPFDAKYSQLRDKYNLIKKEKKDLAKYIFTNVSKATQLPETFVYKHFMNISKNQILLESGSLPVRQNNTPNQSGVNEPPRNPWTLVTGEDLYSYEFA